MLKIKLFQILALCLFTFAFCPATFAQTLTVRDIMREPSLAGMRPDSEKLSPDGKFVIFAWNAEGKEPRNLYIVSTGGGEPKIIVDAEKNFELRTPAPESKLNYGVIVRDDFIKAREKNLGGADFSPNSKRILFTQNGDIYVLDLGVKSNAEQIQILDKNWLKVQDASQILSDLTPKLIKSAQASGISSLDNYLDTIDLYSKLLSDLKQSPQNEKGIETEQQRADILQSTRDLINALNPLLQPQIKIPKSDLNKNFIKLFIQLADEATGIINRVDVATADYNSALQNFSTKPRRVTRTQGAEFAARWLDDATILYQSGGNFYALNIEKTALVQLSREANPQTFISVSSAAPTEDATLLAYIVSDSSKQRALLVPNYLDEFVQSPTFRRGFTEQKVFVVKTDGSLEKPFEIKIPKAEGASYLRGVDWAADNRSLIVDRVDQDTKRRQLFYVYNVGGKDEQTITITEETDDKWIGGLSRIVEANPKDNSQILFASERDGYNHLY
ncbi:MAG: DPP IV N-terminal domain-containing protein, partial [Pyrinomonadaceae bacterium]|nr:DPP IV N-terminal domain-containing protein [Pyrinomonadaceae bacterium]